MNRIIGNVYYIDSGGLWLTSNSASTGEFLSSSVSSVALFGTDSTGELAISYQSDTSAHIFHLRCVGELSSLSFSVPFRAAEKMFVNTCANGTGYLYFA